MIFATENKKKIRKLLKKQNLEGESIKRRISSPKGTEGGKIIMIQIPVYIPESLPHSLKMTQKEFSNEISLLLAMKLYEMGKISASMAADVAGLNRLAFLSLLGKYNVPAINLQGEEVDAEIEAARELGVK